MIVLDFLRKFHLTDIRIIQPDTNRFDAVRRIKAENRRVGAVWFCSGVQRMDLQVPMAATFATAIFTEEPCLGMPRHTVLRFHESDFYLLTEEAEQIWYAESRGGVRVTK